MKAHLVDEHKVVRNNKGGEDQGKRLLNWSLASIVRGGEVRIKKQQGALQELGEGGDFESDMSKDWAGSEIVH